MSDSAFPVFDDESQTGKISRKARDNPSLVIGLAGLIAACGIGAYKYKHRGAMSTSVFLMQLRVAAQGTVVGCLSLGIAYSLCKDYLLKKKNDSD